MVLSESGVHPSWLPVLTDPIRLGVLHRLSSRSHASASALAAACHASERSLRRHLEAMAALSLIHEHEAERGVPAPGRPPARFSLAPAAQEQTLALFAVLEAPLLASHR